MISEVPISFRYKGVKRPDGSITKAPTIPVTIFGKENIDTIGILDSGADIKEKITLKKTEKSKLY